MKIKVFCFCLAYFFINGCSKDDYAPYSYSNEETIFSNENEAVFRELLVIIEPYFLDNGQKKFVAADSIFDVEIIINEFQWGVFSSMEIDPSTFQTTVINGFAVSDDAVKYAVVAPLQTSADTMNTAGDYADLLGEYFTFQPGFYVFKLKSFKLKDATGVVRTVSANVLEPFEIKENSRSAFVGEIEVKIL